MKRFFFFSRKEKRSHYERCRLTEAATGGFLKNFAKFIAKQLCQSLFFDKVAGLRRKWDKWDQPLSDREMGSSYASTSTLPFDNYVFKVNMRNNKVWNVFKVNNKDTRTTPMASFWYLIVNFERISHLVLVFLLLTLSRQTYLNLSGKLIRWRSFCVRQQNDSLSITSILKQLVCFNFAWTPENYSRYSA